MTIVAKTDAPRPLMTARQGWVVIALLALLVMGMFLAWVMIFDLMNSLSNVGDSFNDLPSDVVVPDVPVTPDETCCS